MPHWRRLLTQTVRSECALAFVRAGSSKAARIAMIEMTTNSSISVNAPEQKLAGFATFTKAPLQRQELALSRPCPARTSTVQYIRFYLALIGKKKSNIRWHLWRLMIVTT